MVTRMNLGAPLVPALGVTQTWVLKLPSGGCAPSRTGGQRPLLGESTFFVNVTPSALISDAERVGNMGPATKFNL